MHRVRASTRGHALDGDHGRQEGGEQQHCPWGHTHVVTSFATRGGPPYLTNQVLQYDNHMYWSPEIVAKQLIFKSFMFTHYAISVDDLKTLPY